MRKFIRVVSPSDGGNPRSEYEIIEREHDFLILPFIEGTNPTYKFHLLVKVINEAAESIRTSFTFEWGDVGHTSNGHTILLGIRDNEWLTFKGIQRGSQVSVAIDIPPGESYLSLNPPYTYGRYVEYMRGLDRRQFRVKCYGNSRRNRELLAVEAGDADRRPIVLMSRVHPYETIGSYFVEGMLSWLQQGGKEVQEMVAGTRLIFVPMPNPDGVAEGLCQRNLGGLDFSYAMASWEPEPVALKRYLAEVQALAIFDLHGLMLDHDRVRMNDRDRMHRFSERLRSKPELFDKPLNVFHDSLPINGKEINTGGYVVEQLGGFFINSSWSPFDRSAGQLFEMGVELLKGYADIFAE